MRKVSQKTIQLNRRKGVEWLRTTTLPQGRVFFYSSRSNSYCALGHLCLAVGIDPDQPSTPWDDVKDAYGMSADDAKHIWFMNDIAKKTLPEIADVLAEKWGINVQQPSA